MENEAQCKEKTKKKSSVGKTVLIVAVCLALVIAVVILPVVTVLVYRSNFGSRCETLPWLAFSVTDFPGLEVRRSDFPTRSGVTLAGYQYSKGSEAPKGVVILAHGLGAGHNAYMPHIDYLASNGYLVFAYDATGNDNSAGDGVNGLPQGVIDLDHAIRHVCQVAEYQGLPIVLLGHSWGAYSVGNVLNLHPEVKAAVILAGFNCSEDMMLDQGEDVAGFAIHLLMPYLRLYERHRFGKEYASLSAVEGLANTDAGILIVHSENDTAVPVKYGYDVFYEAFGDSDRFQFIRYADQGHNRLLYAQEAVQIRNQIEEEYQAYVKTHGGVHNAQVKIDFFATCHAEYLQGSKPNPELMDSILALYDTYCAGE